MKSWIINILMPLNLQEEKKNHLNGYLVTPTPSLIAKFSLKDTHKKTNIHLQKAKNPPRVPKTN